MSVNEAREQYEKQIRRMINDPDGLAALSAALGKELVKIDPISNDPIVAVLVPSYAGLDEKMMDSSSRMIKYTQKFCTVFSEPVRGSSLITWTRNDMLSYLHGKKYTHVLWIDDDMVLQEDYLVRMLRADKDIVGCVYPTRTDPPLPNVHLIDLQSCVGPRIYHWNKEELQKSPIPGHTLTAGTGLMLIKKGVIDRVAEFFVNCEYEKMFWKLTDEQIAPVVKSRKHQYGINHNGWWFELLPRLIHNGQTGEDVSFCIKAALCGFDVWIDFSIQPGHVGKYEYSIADYLPFKDNQIAKAKHLHQYGEI